MTVVCLCGAHLRIKLASVTTSRCPKCKTMIGSEAERQATRNADIVLDIAARLYAKPENTWTKEETEIAALIHFHAAAK